MSLNAAPTKATRDSGAVLRAVLVLRGRKPTDVAAILGISAGAASDRLTGKVDFRNREIRKLADELDVPPGLLYLTAEEFMARLIGDGTPRRLIETSPPALASLNGTGVQPTLPGILSPALSLVGDAVSDLT